MSARTSETRRPETAPAKQRDPWFDNIKMTLVTFVVIGHSLTLVPRHTPRAWLYDFVYLWHMPAFVLVTGFFSRSFTWTPKRMWQLVTTLLVPYLIFEGLMTYYRHQVAGVHFKRVWINPHWPMWYLLAVFFWRLVTPAMLRLHPVARIGLAVVASLAGGFYAGDLFDFQRVLGFFPFFVIGLTMRKEDWAWFRSSRGRIAGGLVVVALFVFARFMENWIDVGWLYYNLPYSQLEPATAKALALRLAVVAIGVVGGLAVCTLVPTARSLWTTMGTNSLVVYLCHGFVVVTAGALGIRDFTHGHQLLGLACCILGAIAVASFLALPPVARVLNVLVDPVGTLGRLRRRSSPRPT